MSAEVAALAQQLAQDPAVLLLLEAQTGPAVLLTPGRSLIILANPLFRQILGLHEHEPVPGTPLTECLAEPEGVGLTPGRAGLGPLLARVQRGPGGPYKGTFDLLLRRQGLIRMLAFEAVVVRRHLAIGDLVMVSLRDLGAEQRLDTYQRFFFHDVMNAVGGIVGLNDLITLQCQERGHPNPEHLRMMTETCERLLADLQYRRNLRLAEAGTLKPAEEVITPETLLHALRHRILAEKSPIIPILLGPTCNTPIVTDPNLLQQILFSMVTYCLDGWSGMGSVTLSAEPCGSGVFFAIQHACGLPPSANGHAWLAQSPYFALLVTETVLGGRFTIDRLVTGSTTYRIQLPIRNAPPSEHSHGQHPAH